MLRGASFKVPGGSEGGGLSAGGGGGGGAREWLNEHDVAAVCPEVSHHAVHLPIKVPCSILPYRHLT